MERIQDPRQILTNDLPLFVSKDSATDVVSFLITWRTRGQWNHSMLCRTPGKFIWQGFQITETPMDIYLKQGTSLDFFSLVDINPSAIAAMNRYIDRKKNGPWWGQTYDFLGIFGQAIGLPWIHTPGLGYCSVFELSILRAMAPFLSLEASKIIMAQKMESNPQEIHDMYVKNPDVFKYYGRYDADEGVTT